MSAMSEVDAVSVMPTWAGPEIAGSPVAAVLGVMVPLISIITTDSLSSTHDPEPV